MIFKHREEAQTRKSKGIQSLSLNEVHIRKPEWKGLLWLLFNFILILSSFNSNCTSSSRVLLQFNRSANILCCPFKPTYLHAMHKDFPFKSNLLLKWTLKFRGLAAIICFSGGSRVPNPTNFESGKLAAPTLGYVPAHMPNNERCSRFRFVSRGPPTTPALIDNLRSKGAALPNTLEHCHHHRLPTLNYMSTCSQLTYDDIDDVFGLSRKW